MGHVRSLAIAFLFVVLATAGAFASECFTGKETVNGNTHSIILRNKCEQPMSWRMCITYTWRGTQHFSGVQNPRTAARHDVMLPQGGGYFRWQATWSDGSPAEPPCKPPTG